MTDELKELGDHIAILNKGKLEQIGTPQEVYNNPQTEFVATFLGAANVVEMCRNEDFMAMDCRQCLTQLPRELSLDRVKIVFRPEDVVLSKATSLAEAEKHLGHGVIMDVSFTGALEVVRVKLLSLNQFGYLNSANCQNFDQPCDLVIKVLRTKWDAQRMPLKPSDKVGVWLRAHKILENYDL